MALNIFLFAISCFVFQYTNAISLSPNVGLLTKNNDDCTENCEKSYSPHTYPNSDDYNACSRGCRFFTLSSFIQRPELGDDDDDLNTIEKTETVIKLCFNDCNGSYNTSVSQTQACLFGCKSQDEAFKKQKTSDKFEIKDDGPILEYVRPIMQVREVVSTIRGVLHIVRSSLHTYFVNQDNKVISIESNPEVMIELMPKGLDLSSDDNKGERPIMPRIADLPALSGEFIENESKDNMLPWDDIPSILVIATILPLMIFSIYYMATMMRSNSNKKKSELAVSGIPSADFVTNEKFVVRPEDLTKLSLLEDDDSQAPALPIKVKLPDSTV